MAEAVKAGVGERRSLKLRGTASETTSRTRATPRTTSLKTSRRVIEAPRRRKLSFCERGSTFICGKGKARDPSAQRLRLWAGDRARAGLADRSVHVQDRCDKVAEGHAEMTNHALFQGRVILGAAENIGHELAEDGAAAHKLDHARGNGGAQERATVETAYDARREFKLAGESGADPVAVSLRIAFGNGFAQKFARTHGVEQAFACKRIDESGGVSDERPVFPDHCTLRKRGNLRGREHVAVKAGVFGLEVLLADENLQVLTELGLCVRSHAAADTHR